MGVEDYDKKHWEHLPFKKQQEYINKVRERNLRNLDRGELLMKVGLWGVVIFGVIAAIIASMAAAP